MAHLVDELDLTDFDFFAWDARGHGRSPGARGDSPSFGTSVRDVQTFVDHIGAVHGIAVEDIGIVAQSVGAVVVATWVHDYAPPIRAMVLASPAFAVKLYVPFALPGLKLMRRLRGNFFVTSYVKARFLTHDPERIGELRHRSAAVEADLGQRAARPAGGRRPRRRRRGGDHRADATPDLGRRLGGPTRTAARVLRPAGVVGKGAPCAARLLPRHARRARPIGRHRARAVVHRACVRRPTPPREPARCRSTRRDTRGGRRAGRAAADAVAARSVLGGDARQSELRWLVADGIRLGHATGFDSGATLDYVYRNRATGFTPLGRLIDRTYLDAIGWRGIRQRKLDVEALLREASQRLRAAELPVHVVDVAAGLGRYVLDAFTSGTPPDSILLRDYSKDNVERGRALIAERRLDVLARFELGDAFDRAGLAALSPRPTLGIVSGLYELFPDNAPVRESLAGLADAIPPGGYLVYTGQPWHPQLELIARALTSHREGRAWVMRRRTQDELDQLVATAGFRKRAQLIGETGIFTVSLAERVAA